MVYILASAVFLIISGSMLLYLASRNQKVTVRALPGRIFSLVGGLSLVTALVLLRQYSGSATSVFILMTGVMLVWTIPPMVIAYLRHNGEGQL